MHLVMMWMLHAENVFRNEDEIYSFDVGVLVAPLTWSMEIMLI